MSPRIEPRTLKGFPDTLPAAARARARILRVVEGVFESFGYGPIDTPALEYAEILKGKGGDETDKQMFEFDDAGGRRVALRFDLTVPLARFVAQHQGSLVFPFRRYHAGPVWRGERPQKGREREFLQMDADLVGAVGPAADAEILQVFATAYETLGVGRFEVRVNDRRVLNSVLSAFGLADRATAVLRAIDKWDKVGPEGVRKEVLASGAAPEAAARVPTLADCRGETNEATLARLEAIADPALREGFSALREVLALVRAAGVSESRIRVDPLLARGLDYYTGVVFEAGLLDAPEYGSVGSGGRYDDLASLYTNTRLPGVGCSVGVTRLATALAEKGVLAADAGTDVLVTHPESGGAAPAFALASRLRASGLRVETFPESRKHGAQMRYADKRGIRFVATLDPDGSVQAKDLATSGAFHAPVSGLAAEIERRRREPPVAPSA